jgi:hypothetical protein
MAERCRPLLRPAPVEDRLACFERGTIDDANRERRYLTGCDRYHDFVEERDTLRDLSQPHQRLTLTEPAESDQVQIAEAFANLCGLGKCSVSAWSVTFMQ